MAHLMASQAAIISSKTWKHGQQEEMDHQQAEVVPLELLHASMEDL